MTGREIWGEVKSSALRKHLKYCRNNVCECISSFFAKQNGGRAGLAQRFERMMAPNAVKTGIPTHAKQIQDRQKGLKEAIDIYDDQGCGGPGAPQHAPITQGARDNMNRPIPTIEDWEAEHGRPMPEGDYTPGRNNSLQSPKDTGMLNNPPDNSIWDWEYWEEATGLTGAALGAYLIISEGSRLFGPRNLIPVP